MVLRVVFERRDLQQVCLSTAPDPMWELLLGLQCLHEREVPLRHAAWHHSARRQLTAGATQPWLSTLRALIPTRGNFPDFLTPAPFTADLDAGCEILAGTSPACLHRDISSAFPDCSPAPSVRLLAMGDRHEVRSLVRAVRTGHQVLIAPQWQQICRAVATDWGKRARILINRGIGSFLAGLPGVTGWDDETLTFRYPVDRTLRLAGRGLTLIPSYFCTDAPVTLIDPELPPTLVYPIHHPASGSTAAASVPTWLVSLLSRTRAECLYVLVTPRTTSQLAIRLGVSIGTASKQAMILRNAGLITSVRDGGSVIHQVTALGMALLSDEIAPGLSTEETAWDEMNLRPGPPTSTTTQP